jgi:ferritin-like metal-binding protein YciE
MAIIGSLRDLLVVELQILHQAESRLRKVLPRIAKAASRTDLKERLRTFQQETEEQGRRLERALTQLGALPSVRDCRAMVGLVAEAEEAIYQVGPNAVRDANLIGKTQRIAHYQMAAYAVAEVYARKIGQFEVAVLLALTQAEMAEATRNLAALATLVLEEAFQLIPKAAAAGARR